VDRRLEATLLAVILLLAVGLRAAYFMEVHSSPARAQPLSDAAFNHSWAQSVAARHPASGHMANGHPFREMPYFKAPGYPFFLIVVYTLFEPSPAVARMLQMALGVGSCLLAYRLTRAHCGSPAALLAACFMGGYWVLIYYEAVLHAPTLTVFLALTLLNVLDKWQAAWNPWRTFALGLFVGYFILVRKNVLVFLPLVIAWVGRRSGLGAPSPVSARVLSLLLGVLVVIAPVTLRNYRVSGEWVPISCDAGRNLYMGNHPGADGVSPRIPGQQSFTGTRTWNLFTYPEIVRGWARHRNVEPSCSSAERYFARQALKFVVERPLNFLSLTFKKALLFWGPLEVSSDRVVHYDRLSSPLLSRLPGHFSATLALAWLGCLLHVARSARRDRLLLLVLGFILLYFLSFLPGIPESRYRVGLLPFLFLFGGYAVQGIAELLARRRWKEGLAWSTVGVALYLLVSPNYVGYQPDQAKWHFETAVAHEQVGQTDAARASYRKAIRERPHFIEAHNNLGVLEARAGTPAAAERHFRQALELDPAHRSARHNLASLYLEQGRPERAVAVCRAALATDPADATAYNLLGLAAARLGHFAAATAYYRKAISLRPDAATAHNNLGTALVRMRRLEDAERHFEEALRIAPDYTEAQKNLERLRAHRDKPPFEPESH